MREPHSGFPTHSLRLTSPGPLPAEDLNCSGVTGRLAQRNGSLELSEWLAAANGLSTLNVAQTSPPSSELFCLDAEQNSQGIRVKAYRRIRGSRTVRRSGLFGVGPSRGATQKHRSVSGSAPAGHDSWALAHPRCQSAVFPVTRLTRFSCLETGVILYRIVVDGREISSGSGSSLTVIDSLTFFFGC